MGESEALLRRAWEDWLSELASARDAVDQPELMPAPPSDRNLAEGYRYLMGFVHGAIERAFFEDPMRPVFRNVLHPISKGTIDNADAIYFSARIDGRESYVLRGRAEDARHWRGKAPAETGRKAPQYLIFEVSHGCLAGDSGSLAELRPGIKVQTGRLDSSDLEVEEDGSFEVLLAPERPVGHRGNFISTHRHTRRPNPDDPAVGPDRYADYVSGRQLFYDWEREDPVPLTLTRLGEESERPTEYTPERAAGDLRRMGALARGPMHFWNEFYTVLLETYGKRDGSGGPRFMPRNAFNATNAASRETGGGQSTNLYAGGVFELGPEEALIVEATAPIPPEYSGFHLANLWGESLDFANHQSSLNGFQAERDADGVTRYVVAHRDPGVPNWLDTTGHPEGFLTPRWAYSTTPDPEQWPSITATVVAFGEVRAALPPETRRVAPEEREARIRVRQEHVKRRYRAF